MKLWLLNCFSLSNMRVADKLNLAVDVLISGQAKFGEKFQLPAYDGLPHEFFSVV